MNKHLIIAKELIELTVRNDNGRDPASRIELAILSLYKAYAAALKEEGHTGDVSNMAKIETWDRAESLFKS